MRLWRLDLGRDPVPDATTILKFCYLLEQHQLGQAIFAEVGRILQERGLRLSAGTIVDATIIAAPSSTKNANRVFTTLAMVNLYMPPGARRHTCVRRAPSAGLNAREQQRLPASNASNDRNDSSPCSRGYLISASLTQGHSVMRSSATLQRRCIGPTGEGRVGLRPAACLLPR